MAKPLPHGTRIGALQLDGTLAPGTIIGLAFGEGFYRATFADHEGGRITCIHRDEVIIEPRFASLAEAAAAMRARDQRVALDFQLKIAGGGF